MKIDYCPKCHKAGLRYEDKMGMDKEKRTSKDRYELMRNGVSHVSTYGLDKWCARCQEWVRPEIKEWSRR